MSVNLRGQIIHIELRVERRAAGIPDQLLRSLDHAEAIDLVGQPIDDGERSPERITASTSTSLRMASMNCAP